MDVRRSKAGVGFGLSMSSPRGEKEGYHWYACSYKNGILNTVVHRHFTIPYDHNQ